MTQVKQNIITLETYNQVVASIEGVVVVVVDEEEAAHASPHHMIFCPMTSVAKN